MSGSRPDRGAAPPDRGAAPQARGVAPRGGDAALRTRDSTLRVAVLSSRRAPGLAALLAAAREPGSPFEVVVLVASRPDCRELETARRAEVPVRVHDVAAFCGARGAGVADLDVRPAYDRATAGILEPFRPDLVVLCGYLLLVTAPLLDAWPDRIVNVHDADLRLVDGDGAPRYPGLRATRDAIAAGEPETRTTVHLATHELDAGPPILVSAAYAVSGMLRDPRVRSVPDVVSAYAYAQRGWMMETCWGPLLVRTAELFARGAVRVRDGRVAVDGGLGPAVLESAGPAAGASAGGGRPLAAARAGS